MTLEQILIWVVIGATAGFLAESLLGGVQIRLIGTILIGVLGAFIGGWLFGMLGISIGTGWVNEGIKAFAGAIILLVIVRLIRR